MVAVWFMKPLAKNAVGFGRVTDRTRQWQAAAQCPRIIHPKCNAKRIYALTSYVARSLRRLDDYTETAVATDHRYNISLNAYL